MYYAAAPDARAPAGRARRGAARRALRCAGAALLLGAGAGCASDLNREQLAVEYFNLGTGYLELGEAQQAADYFRRGLELDPAAAEARFNLAVALLELEDPAAAGRHLRLLRAADPDNVRVLELQALSQQRGGRLGDALATYRTLLQVQPDHTAARYNAAILLWSLAEFTAAEAELRALLDHAPDDQEARYRLGLLLAQTGPPEEAAAVLGEYLEATPDDADAWLHLAQMERQRERFEAALDAYAAAAELLPADDQRRAETAFERAVILLTVVEDHLTGLEALEAALEAGFGDRERLAELLAAESLVRREAVLEAVTAQFPDLAADDTPDPTAEPPAP